MLPINVDRIFFIRHGETDWNAEGRMQGQQDIPLNARGHVQAASAGKTLRSLLDVKPAAIAADFDFLASPLYRTRQTMEIVRHQLRLAPQPYALDDRLKEITFGRWEGLTWDEVEAKDPEMAAGRIADKWGFVPPGGESYAMVAERIRPLLKTLTGDTIIVSHGGIARVFMALIGGVDSSLAPNLDVWQGRVLVFQNGTCTWV
jgi:broad specificity phosphatase PhoE